MTVEDGSESTMTLWAVSGIVVALTLLLSVLLFLFARSPLRPVHSRELEGLFVWSLLVCMVVSPVGGLYLFFNTRNRWWFLTILPFAGALIMWILLALMSPVTFH